MLLSSIERATIPEIPSRNFKIMTTKATILTEWRSIASVPENETYSPQTKRQESLNYLIYQSIEIFQ